MNHFQRLHFAGLGFLSAGLPPQLVRLYHTIWSCEGARRPVSSPEAGSHSRPSRASPGCRRSPPCIPRPKARWLGRRTRCPVDGDWGPWRKWSGRVGLVHLGAEKRCLATGGRSRTDRFPSPDRSPASGWRRRCAIGRLTICHRRRTDWTWKRVHCKGCKSGQARQPSWPRQPASRPWSSSSGSTWSSALVAGCSRFCWASAQPSFWAPLLARKTRGSHSGHIWGCCLRSGPSSSSFWSHFCTGLGKCACLCQLWRRLRSLRSLAHGQSDWWHLGAGECRQCRCQKSRTRSQRTTEIALLYWIWSDKPYGLSPRWSSGSSQSDLAAIWTACKEIFWLRWTQERSSPVDLRTCSAPFIASTKHLAKDLCPFSWPSYLHYHSVYWLKLWLFRSKLVHLLVLLRWLPQFAGLSEAVVLFLLRFLWFWACLWRYLVSFLALHLLGQHWISRCHCLLSCHSPRSSHSHFQSLYLNFWPDCHWPLSCPRWFLPQLWLPSRQTSSSSWDSVNWKSVISRSQPSSSPLQTALSLKNSASCLARVLCFSMLLILKQNSLVNSSPFYPSFIC